jgi:parallel beta-helix repeat protein
MIRQFKLSKSLTPVDHLLRLLLEVVMLVMLGAAGLSAATLCVAPGGKGGCYESIGAAVGAASANDTINVGQGMYHEYVVIDRPLSVIGANAQNTVVDATGLPNAFNIDGHNNPGLSHVVLSGFTARNANFQGILVTDSSFVSVSNNIVTGNDHSLQPFNPGGPICPGLPSYFEAGEGFDCGEGIHLSGVHHSTVANNLVQNNAGGILVSDDTAPSHDNLISGNTVQNNPYDCGITIASHHFAFALDPTWGVFHNTISGNVSSGNGLATGEGAGVGLFAGPPGAQTFGNIVINNILTGNGLPGVTMHSHTAIQNLNDNLIVGNQISGNGPDGDPGTTVPTGIVVFSDDLGGAPPITGTLISQNVIKGEGIDIAIKTPGSVEVHFNNLFGGIGIDNLGGGAVNATQNWWKCSGGPGANGCGTTVGGNVLVAPWLTEPF